MRWCCPRPGVVTISAPGAPDVDCLMCPWEPACYDAVCDFLPDDTKAAEVGSFKGGSACVLARGMARRGKALALSCHDLFAPFEAEGSTHDIDRHFDEAVRGWGVPATKVKGDSRATHAVHADASLDYVFIDGDHSYEGAAADIRNFLPKLKPGGWMVVQDVIREVARALDDAVPPDMPRMLVSPPYGHYVMFMHRDPATVDRFRAHLQHALRRPTAEL